MSNFLKEGDVIQLNSGHRVYANVPRHFIFENTKGDFTLTNHDVSLVNFEYLQGKYIVTKTEVTGGNTGYDTRDPFPDGHKVTCKKVGSLDVVSFYQSGSFTAMIKDIKPIARAKLTWVIDEGDK